MADKVLGLLEESLPSFMNLIKRDVFSVEEVGIANEQRKVQEYNLLKESVKASDFLSMIQFQYEQERVRSKRSQDMQLPVTRPHDFVIRNRISSIWNRCTLKFKYRIDLWLQYLAFCYSINSKKSFDRVVSRALRFNPTQLALWRAAVLFQFQKMGNPFKGRRIMLKGLSINKKHAQFWLQFIKLQQKLMQILKSSDLVEDQQEEPQVGEMLLFSGQDFRRKSQHKFSRQSNTKSMLTVLDSLCQHTDLAVIAESLWALLVGSENYLPELRLHFIKKFRDSVGDRFQTLPKLVWKMQMSFSQQQKDDKQALSQKLRIIYKAQAETLRKLDHDFSKENRVPNQVIKPAQLLQKMGKLEKEKLILKVQRMLDEGNPGEILNSILKTTLSRLCLNKPYLKRLFSKLLEVRLDQTLVKELLSFMLSKKHNFCQEAIKLFFSQRSEFLTDKELSLLVNRLPEDCADELLLRTCRLLKAHKDIGKVVQISRKIKSPQYRRLINDL